MHTNSSGVVTVVLVNYKGTEDTLTSVAALLDCDWPASRLEIIVVENGSGTEYARPLRESTMPFRLIETGENLGFTGGCNRGVAEAEGEYIAFLNNDARPDRAWIREAVETFERDASIGAVASKVLDWEGARIDFTEAAITWYGMGYKPHAGEQDTGRWQDERDVLFGTGAAMFIRAHLFEELGGFDDRFFMFYDDVDLGWRLNLLGWRFRYQPTSIAYHKHHASMKAFGEFRETYLLERNALFALYKNLGDDELNAVLPSALALAIRRGVARGELDSTQLDLRRKGKDTVEDMPVSRMTMAGVFAVDQFVEQLPSLTESRRQVQKTRRRSDRDLRELFGEVDEPAYPIAGYLDGYERVLNATDPTAFHRRRRILLVVETGFSAGSEARSTMIAEALARDHDVRLVGIDSAPTVRGANSTIVSLAHPEGMVEHVEWAHVLIVPIGQVDSFPALMASDKPFVFDIGGDGRKRIGTGAPLAIDELLRECDYVLADDEAGRLWWTDRLIAAGRITPAILDGNPRIASMIGLIGPPVRASGNIESGTEHPAGSSGAENLRIRLSEAADLAGLVDFCLRPTRAGEPACAPPLIRTDAIASGVPWRAEVAPRSRLRALYTRLVPERAKARIARWRRERR